MQSTNVTGGSSRVVAFSSVANLVSSNKSQHKYDEERNEWWRTPKRRALWSRLAWLATEQYAKNNTDSRLTKKKNEARSSKIAEKAGWEGAVPLIAPVLLCHSPGVIFKLHFSFPHQTGRHMHHLKNYLMNAAFEMERTGLDTGCMKCAGEPQELQTAPLKVTTLLLSNSLIWIMHRGPNKVKLVCVMCNIIW